MRIANGQALTRICRDPAMPDVKTVYRWLDANEAFRLAYARAREDQADTLADEIIEIADESIKDRNADGSVNWESVNRAKLRVDARKWAAAKLKPKKYGERIEQHHSGDVVLNVTPKDVSVI